ncbi:hypothetical protein [Ideonella sp.]|uniref:hypothetical protein n=1 Tax=Ideonella sp. TaxID=1929293 RepID=UPI0035AE113A
MLHWTGRNGDDRETTSRADTAWYLPGLATLRAPHFGPPFGFDQMARSRARPSGQIRWVSAQPSGRAIITIWSNLNAAYF